MIRLISNEILFMVFLSNPAGYLIRNEAGHRIYCAHGLSLSNWILEAMTEAVQALLAGRQQLAARNKVAVFKWHQPTDSVRCKMPASYWTDRDSATGLLAELLTLGLLRFLVPLGSNPGIPNFLKRTLGVALVNW